MKTLLITILISLSFSQLASAKALIVCPSLQNDASYGDDPYYNFAKLVNEELNLSSRKTVCIQISNTNELILVPEYILDGESSTTFQVSLISGTARFEPFKDDRKLRRKQRKLVYAISEAASEYEDAIVKTPNGLSLKAKKVLKAREVLKLYLKKNPLN